VPRLYHRPPKYRLHKSTKQAIVSFNGRRIYLGPYGSEKSHQGYQEILTQWQSGRHQQGHQASPESRAQAVANAITPETLREKRRQGLAITINELVLVYRRHTKVYYRKNGKITREAELIDEVIRLVRKKIRQRAARRIWTHGFEFVAGGDD
jgi:hypothetical protein